MKYTLAILLVGVWVGPEKCTLAADRPGRLQIYPTGARTVGDFEPRALTTREQELIHQIIASDADFHAHNVPDAVVGQVKALDQSGATFASFSVSCRNVDISRRVRPLCEQLGMPLGLSLSTGPRVGGNQIAEWRGCALIRRLHLTHPHMDPADLLGLSDYLALEVLQFGSVNLRSADFTRINGVPAYLGPVPAITNELVDTLAGITSLRRLSLLGCPVTATNLGRLQNVRSLWVRNAELTPSTLASCAGLAQIEELDLTGSVLTQQQPMDWSELRRVRTLGLPYASPEFGQTLSLNRGLQRLPELTSLSFTRLRGSTWPDLTAIPDQIEQIEFIDVVLDGLDALGFVDARLQAHCVRFRRLADSQKFVLTDMQGQRTYESRHCRIAGRQVDVICGLREDDQPTEFRIVEFPHWTIESGFGGQTRTSAPQYPGFKQLERRASQQLARLGLSIGPEPLGGGFVIGPLADVYLRWERSLALPSDAGQAVDQLVQIPLQKLVLTTSEFPLERLTEFERIKTLRSFELKHEGLTDEHLEVVQSWGHLQELTIHSPGNQFSRRALDKLAESLPMCDLVITAGAGGRPLLWQKQPPGQPAGPPIVF